MNSTAEPIVPNLSATSGLLFENNFTERIPTKEQIRPSEDRANGMNCRALRSPPRFATFVSDIDAAKAIEAIIAPQ